MNKYKSFEELKEELGDKFEEYMYQANIELLEKLDKINEILDNHYYFIGGRGCGKTYVMKILDDIQKIIKE